MGYTEVLKACLYQQLFLEAYDEISNDSRFRQSIRNHGRRFSEGLVEVFEKDYTKLLNEHPQIMGSTNDAIDGLISAVSELHPEDWPRAIEALKSINQHNDEQLSEVQASCKT